jgi:hypothetical protein
VHESERRYFFYAQQYTNLVQQFEKWNIPDHMFLLDSLVMEFQDTVTNTQFLASLSRGDRVLELHAVSFHGAKSSKWNQPSILSMKIGFVSNNPLCISFVPSVTTMPIAGDACFLLRAVDGGHLHLVFEVFFSL